MTTVLKVLIMIHIYIYNAFSNSCIAFFVFAVFIYSMPGYTCSIKERMLYSSCKNPLIDTVEKNLGIEIAKKVLHVIYVYSIHCSIKYNIHHSVKFLEVSVILKVIRPFAIMVKFEFSPLILPFSWKLTMVMN